MYGADREKLSEIARRYNLDLIVIFGSQVRGRDVPGSDVDVAVRFVRREWGNVDLELDLLDDLGEAIDGDGDLDVAFLNGAAPLLLYQVACTGVPLYERTPGDFALFQSYAARRYYDSQKFSAAQDRYLREHYGS
jgi:predicted nucleotidyltransferase